MKIPSLVITAALFCGVCISPAATITAGPKGGRLLDTQPNRAEFFVNADRRVEVTFYDDGLKPVPPATQSVVVTAEPAGKKLPIAMEKMERGFVSAAPLPAGEPYRVVVQVRENAEAKPKNYRIDFNTAECGECKHAEYACTCEGH